MKIRKMLKQINKMRKAGTLPVLDTETIELPFGAKLILIKHPKFKR